MSFLDIDDFRFVVRTTPLFAIDLIIQDHRQHVLVGLRENQPARNFWFVPGGRVLKNEPLGKACARILATEVGLPMPDGGSIRLHGVFEHIYTEGQFDDESINAHYIIAACNIAFPPNHAIAHDDQHKAMKFISIDALLADTSVHQFTKNYFFSDPPNRFP
jgi:colanic acid biosynthesis protein WcaH